MNIVRLREEHLQAMVDHALDDAPVECCGILVARDGTVESVRRMRNTEASPYRFKIDPLEYAKLERGLDDDQVVAGFYHSHTGSEARPSPTDIRAMGAFFGPPFVHFVIGVADRTRPHARVFFIEGATATEHEYEVVPAKPAAATPGG